MDVEVAAMEIDIQSRIYTIRGVQVMLDRDLAELYGVEVKYLNRQVKRNGARFPSDFMFQLTREECLRCQIVTLNGGQYGHLTKSICGICHDRFIVIDRKELFWCGASLKDAGRLTFAVAKMGASLIPGLLDSLHRATTERTSY